MSDETHADRKAVVTAGCESALDSVLTALTALIEDRLVADAARAESVLALGEQFEAELLAMLRQRDPRAVRLLS